MLMLTLFINVYCTLILFIMHSLYTQHTNDPFHLLSCLYANFKCITFCDVFCTQFCTFHLDDTFSLHIPSWWYIHFARSILMIHSLCTQHLDDALTLDPPVWWCTHFAITTWKIHFLCTRCVHSTHFLRSSTWTLGTLIPPVVCDGQFWDVTRNETDKWKIMAAEKSIVIEFVRFINGNIVRRQLDMRAF